MVRLFEAVTSIPAFAGKTISMARAKLPNTIDLIPMIAHPWVEIGARSDRGTRRSWQRPSKPTAPHGMIEPWDWSAPIATGRSDHAQSSIQHREHSRRDLVPGSG